MMNWDWFIYFAVLSVVLWTAGSWNAFKGSQSKACVFMVVGLLVFGTFIGLLWESLERPPLRTMGETRLWYSFFLPLCRHCRVRGLLLMSLSICSHTLCWVPLP